MWHIRVLNGPQAGHIFKLKPGSNTIGRASSCDITLSHSGVSKRHCKIDVYEHEVIINDLGSRNGTFVNGVKIKNSVIKENYKIGVYDILLELVANLKVATPPMSQTIAPNHAMGNVAYNLDNVPGIEHNHQLHSVQMAYGNPQASAEVSPTPMTNNGFLGLVQNYIEKVMLPGVYKLAEMFEFRWVLMMFMAAFIVFVTSLSAIPLVRILKSSIERESQRRALTIAKTLARVNQSPLAQGLQSAVSVDIAMREPGVERAYIISSIDGNIISPASQAGSYPKEKFVHTARREARESVGQIDSSTIGALSPIQFYNSNTGTQSVSAYAVVIYNMGSLAIDDGRTLSLFIQTLLIALIVGGILFFFMYKLIQRPFALVNSQMDRALKEGHSDIHLDFQFPEAQNLVSNIVSALNRAATSGTDSSAMQSFDYDRNNEMSNIVQLIGFGAISINLKDQSIAAVNAGFEEVTGINSANLLYSNIDNISDQSLKLSLKDLLERVQSAPDQIAVNDLEFSGVSYELMAQAVFGKDEISYVVVVILPKEDEGAY